MKKIIQVLILISLVSGFTYSQQFTRCRNGLYIWIPQLATLKDSVQISLGNQCHVVDVNMIIDTLEHTWDNDMIMYLQHLSAGVQIINRVGGAGDNFLH